jgi:hypothetical protein
MVASGVAVRAVEPAAVVCAVDCRRVPVVKVAS